MRDTSRLFEPLNIGKCKLRHRIAMSPLTRFRADMQSNLLPFVKEYYGQRASIPGTLLVSEATAISDKAVGFSNVPGIWNKKQIHAWREVADSVHSKGSFIFLQLWATGRSAGSDELSREAFELVSSSSIPIDTGGLIPRSLTEEEVQGYISDYAQAAKNAISAGMDGVEIHGANGYLLDQFTQSSCNQRNDQWGGSIERRARFTLEVARAVVAAIGPDRVGMKLTPWGRIQGMGTMDELIPQFQYLISRLSDMGIAYLHLANSRWIEEISVQDESNEILLQAWGNAKPVILEGGYDSDSAKQEVDVAYHGYDVAIAFGRHFLSNPDLPFRIKMGIELEKYDRETFYTPMLPKGYVDYPFSAEFLSTRHE